MTHVEQIAFDMIAKAGDAKAKIMSALKAARNNNFGEAEGLLKDADELLLHAHEIQTQELIKKQAEGGLGDSYNVIVGHAQDYLMTSMAMKEMAVEIVNLYAKVRGI